MRFLRPDPAGSCVSVGGVPYSNQASARRFRSRTTGSDRAIGCRKGVSHVQRDEAGVRDYPFVPVAFLTRAVNLGPPPASLLLERRSKAVC